MPVTTFEIYGYPEKEIKAEAPDWDKQFEKTEKWGKLACDFTELTNIIEKTAEKFRKNIPQFEKEIVAIKQTTGTLNIHIRGGIRVHSDCDMWVTKKTLRPIMRILCSIRAFKQELENLTPQEKARDFYHDVINAFRYVNEPDKPDIEDHLVNTSGNYILPGTTILSSGMTVENVFRRVGYVFVGDEPREKHGSYVDEILGKLRNLKDIKSEREKHGHGKTDNIAIDDKELTILTELAEVSDKTYSQVEIEASTSIKRGTLKDKLQRLERIGLIHRPLGKRKGYKITDKGREIAHRNE